MVVLDSKVLIVLDLTSSSSPRVVGSQVNLQVEKVLVVLDYISSSSPRKK